MATANRSGWLTLGVAATLLLVAATGASQAGPTDLASTTPDAAATATSSSSLYACVKKKNGRMRMITRGPCEKGEYLVVWSVVGPPGARGAKGPTGSKGPVGPTGPVGPEGPVGPPNGSTVLSGQGQPSASVGKVGDFYVNLQNWTMWGPKTGDTWTLGTTLIGPTGAAGPAGPSGGIGPQGPMGPQGPAGPSGYGAYGAFGDHATQSITVFKDDTPILVRQSLVNSGFRWSDDSTVLRLAPGTSPGWFNIAFSIQVVNKTNSDNDAYFWLRWNGVDQPWSNTGVYLENKTAKKVAAWNFFVPMDADDSVTIMWATSAGAADLLAEAPDPSLGPTIPSVILAVSQVSNTGYRPL